MANSQYSYSVSPNGTRWLWFVTKDSEVVASGEADGHAEARTAALAYWIHTLEPPAMRQVA